MTGFEHHVLPAPSLGGEREILVYGQYGRPVLWFPSEAGGAWDFPDHGMVEALCGPLDAGHVKVFCVPSYDLDAFSARGKPMGDRARAHLAYEDWIIWRVVPFIRDHCAGRDDIVTAGPSMGAFHAVLFALRHAHVFGRAVALSGVYDPWRWHAWGDRDENTYLTNPTEFVPRAENGHLDFLRRAVHLTLVVGQGQWEDTTGALDSTLSFAGSLRDKQIPHELAVWGHEWPHDWPSWQAQAHLYLSRLR